MFHVLTPLWMSLQMFIFFAAAQMWIFSTYLPLIIGHRIPPDNNVWECYLNLLEITDICTARVVSVSMAGYLSVLIEDHHVAFKRCYPGASIIPKMHYMVHFPAQMCKYVEINYVYTETLIFTMHV
jgi:hypothetical protein